MPYRSPAEVSTVVHIPPFLLQVDLDPVVKANHRFVSRLTNKHMLKATGIQVAASGIKYMNIAVKIVWCHNNVVQYNVILHAAMQ